MTTALSVSTSTTADDEVSTISTKLEQNPLLRSWSGEPYHLPPFKSIEPSHFQPALQAAMEAHTSDLEAIASSTSNDFDSILGAYDRAGSLYSKVASVYGNYISSLNTPDMQQLQTTMAPILSRHRSKCYNIPSAMSASANAFSFAGGSDSCTNEFEALVKCFIEKGMDVDNLESCTTECSSGEEEPDNCDGLCTVIKKCATQCASGCDGEFDTAYLCAFNDGEEEQCTCPAGSMAGVSSIGSFALNLSKALKKKNLRA